MPNSSSQSQCMKTQFAGLVNNLDSRLFQLRKIEAVGYVFEAEPASMPIKPCMFDTVTRGAGSFFF